MAPERKLLPGKRGWSKHEAMSLRLTPGSDDDLEDESLEVSLQLDVMTPEEQAVINAKVELMKTCDGEGISLYHHLSHLLTDVLTSHTPESAARHLEDISRRIKRERMKSFLQVLEAEEPILGVTKAEWELFKTIGHEIPDINPKREFTPRIDRQGHSKSRNLNSSEESDNNQTGTTRASFEQTGEAKTEPVGVDQKLRLLPDLMRQCHMFNMAGYGLPPTEYTKLTLAVRELVLEWPLKSLRFWGKIIGTHGNYYVVETQMMEDVDNDDDNDNENDDNGDDFTNNNDDNDKGSSDDEHFLFDEYSDNGSDIAHKAYKPPPAIPSEEPGVGVNAFVYFVCSQPGLPWHRLPYVTPQQIVVARQITSLFTGDLEHVHATYPPFPGNEAGYLRAQIARITSSTCISPIGYFKFDEDAEEEEEHAEAIRESCILDEEFDGLPMRDLGDSSLQYWAHNINYILPQGRTTWFNPLDAPAGGQEGEEEDEEGEEERNDPDEFEPEIPQPLLGPISEDVDVGPSPPWIARVTSQFIPEHSPVAVTSVRWPGAVTVATDRGKFYENLYIGWGLKCLDDNFDPAIPPEPVMEFPTGPEVIEQEDPTPEEEAAMRAVMKEQEELIMENEDEDEEEGEEEEDENGEAYE